MPVIKSTKIHFENFGSWVRGDDDEAIDATRKSEIDLNKHHEVKKQRKQRKTKSRKRWRVIIACIWCVSVPVHGVTVLKIKLIEWHLTNRRRRQWNRYSRIAQRDLIHRNPIKTKINPIRERVKFFFPLRAQIAAFCMHRVCANNIINSEISVPVACSWYRCHFN